MMDITYSKMGSYPQFIKRTLILVTCFLILLPVYVYAFTADIKVSVTLTDATCDIYSQEGKNKPIEVDLKDIVSTYIDGIQYETEIPYLLECSNSNSNPSLSLSLNGPMAQFGTGLLSTSEDELGLALRADGSLVNIGNKINFNYTKKPYLTVTPVIGNNNALKGGAFNASATLIVNFN